MHLHRNSVNIWRISVEIRGKSNFLFLDVKMVGFFGWEMVSHRTLPPKSLLVLWLPRCLYYVSCDAISDARKSFLKNVVRDKKCIICKKEQKMVTKIRFEVKQEERREMEDNGIILMKKANINIKLLSRL